MKISLKQMFLIVAVCAVVVAIGLWATQEYRCKIAIRGRLEALGASSVMFTKSEKGGPLQTHVVFPQPPKSRLNEQDNVRSVEFKGFDVTPECFEACTI